MTASAIQGDREKCLESGMNNYLAKPVRAQTLKALLDSYLSQEQGGEEAGDLQAEARKIVKETLSEAELTVNGQGGDVSPTKSSPRPQSTRTNTAQRLDGTGTPVNGLSDSQA